MSRHPVSLCHARNHFTATVFVSSGKCVVSMPVVAFFAVYAVFLLPTFVRNI